VGLLDSYHRNILEYLIMKYPPSQNKIVDIELSRKIKEVSKHNDPQYEMLNNAWVSFSNKTNNKDFTKEIKIWLNILTKEVKKQFPKFS
jgi:predicted component of type VI protein secretion system